MGFGIRAGEHEPRFYFNSVGGIGFISRRRTRHLVRVSLAAVLEGTTLWPTVAPSRTETLFSRYPSMTRVRAPTTPTLRLSTIRQRLRVRGARSRTAHLRIFSKRIGSEPACRRPAIPESPIGPGVAIRENVSGTEVGDRVKNMSVKR
jgi:hypothetical protein